MEGGYHRGQELSPADRGLAIEMETTTAERGGGAISGATTGEWGNYHRQIWDYYRQVGGLPPGDVNYNWWTGGLPLKCGRTDNYHRMPRLTWTAAS